MGTKKRERLLMPAKIDTVTNFISSNVSWKTHLSFPKTHIVFPIRVISSVFLSPGGSVIKNPLPIQKMWVWSLGWEDPLEKKMAICSNILAWEIPWTEETGRLQSMGLQRLRHDWVTLSYDMVIMSPFIGSRVCISVLMTLSLATLLILISGQKWEWV